MGRYTGRSLAHVLVFPAQKKATIIAQKKGAPEVPAPRGSRDAVKRVLNSTKVYLLSATGLAP